MSTCLCWRQLHLHPESISMHPASKLQNYINMTEEDDTDPVQESDDNDIDSNED